MASKSYEGNYKAWLLESQPAGWDPEAGGVVTASELSAGTRLLRLVSAGGITYTYTENTASQAKLDQGKVGHAMGTQEVTGGQIIHEVDFPKEDDAMYSLYSYGDERYLVVAPDVTGGSNDQPADGAHLDIFRIETGRPHAPQPDRDTKQNAMVNWACEDFDFAASFDDESTA